MKECWAEGDLRAYLDHELTAEEQEQVAAHLKGCADCSGRYLELAERAARVGSLVAMLPEPAPQTKVRMMPSRKWTVAAVALAAALAIAFLMLPKHGKIPRQAAGVSEPVEQLASISPVPIETNQTVIQRTSARRPKVHNASTRQNGFISLDGEPIETGVVMRVGVEGSDVEAELIVGPDGRAHAFRLVSTK